MSRILEISSSQSRPIRLTLILHPMEEHPHLVSLKASTFKPKSITQDATMNEYDASNLNATLVNKCKSRNVPYISGCSVCSACSTMRPLPPREISSHMPKLSTEITYRLPCLIRSPGLCVLYLTSTHTLAPLPHLCCRRCLYSTPKLKLVPLTRTKVWRNELYTLLFYN